MERGVMTESTDLLLLSLHRFMSLLDKRLGGAGNTKVHGFRHRASVPNSQ